MTLWNRLDILEELPNAAWDGTIEHENYSPPLEGCRGGLSPTGRPTPKAEAFCPSLEGIFMGVLIVKKSDTERIGRAPPTPSPLPRWGERKNILQLTPSPTGGRGCLPGDIAVRKS
ncbi:MAG: hypothetical protein DMG06_19350 [Acidobacteria bacterium]|nr:MAG: hypothetical protein DMG06_19350 [Acidobacteriota bacterium]